MRAAGLPTRLTWRAIPPRVPAAAQLTVYRLVQEALTNTLKHAPRATRAEVRVSCAAEAVTVDVTDDGRPPRSLRSHRPDTASPACATAQPPTVAP